MVAVKLDESNGCHATKALFTREMTTDNCTFSSCSSTRHPPSAVLPDPQQRQPGWNEPSGALCHTPKPRTTRRRKTSLKQHGRDTFRMRPWTSPHYLMFAVLFSVLFCCQGVRAGNVHLARHVERRAELVFDRGEPPVPRMRLEERKETSTGSSKHHHGSAESTLQNAASESQIPLPQPFDTSLGNNFTVPSCPAFFQRFLTNETFKNCLPFSLLLQVSQHQSHASCSSTLTIIEQTSNGFFSATRSLVRITQTLDATCSVDYHQCSAVMASLVQEIQSENNCGADLQMQNPMVTQAYNGFVAYQPLFHAGCLTDNDGNYCFSNAVTNSNAPTSSYVYYLPLGVELPGGTQPKCDKCLRNTMSIFATYASNSSQPLSSDYGSAAQNVDMFCGPKFVEGTVQVGSSAASFTSAGGLGFLSLFIVLLNFLI